MDDKQNVAQTAFEKAEEYLDGKVVTIVEPGTGVEALAFVQGGNMSPISPAVFDGYRTAPKRVKDTAGLSDLASFIAYTNRFKSEESALFMDDDAIAPSLTAIIDYHHERTGQDAIAADFSHHKAVFNFPLSDEWKVWTDNNATYMEMAQFARFLEDHVQDVLPTEFITVADDDDETKRFLALSGGKQALAEPAKLMEVANNLTINEASVVTNAQNLSTGEAAIEFATTHESTMVGNKKVTVPKIFAIGVPVFKNGQVYRLFARLRYRKTGGKILFSYDLYRENKVFQHAIDEVAEKAQTETGLPLFKGHAT